MIALHAVFWGLVFLFAVIGALRGVAKELLVSFAVVAILALFGLLQQFAPAAWKAFTPDKRTEFVMETLLIGAVALLGYAGPVLSVELAGRTKREKGVEIIAGFAAGAVNGWLIAGSILFFLHQAGYPFPEILQPPGDNSPVMGLLTWMPPAVMKPPLLYFMPIAALVLVLIFYL